MRAEFSSGTLELRSSIAAASRTWLAERVTLSWES